MKEYIKYKELFIKDRDAEGIPETSDGHLLGVLMKKRGITEQLLFVIVLTHLSNNWILYEVRILDLFHFKHKKAKFISSVLITLQRHVKSRGKNRKLSMKSLSYLNKYFIKLYGYILLF